jgi:hypothetical protein
MPSTEITDREPGSGYGAKRIDGGSTEDHQAIPSRPAGFLMVPALFPPSRIDENRRWHFVVDLLRSQMITLGLKLCVCEGVLDPRWRGGLGRKSNAANQQNAS